MLNGTNKQYTLNCHLLRVLFVCQIVVGFYYGMRSPFFLPNRLRNMLGPCVRLIIIFGQIIINGSRFRKKIKRNKTKKTTGFIEVFFTFFFFFVSFL